MSLDMVGMVVIMAGTAVLAIAAAVLLVIKFGHPDDKNTAMFPKFIVVLSLFLATACVLMFPLDVACTRAQSGVFAVGALWLTLFSIIAFLIVFVIPFAVFYYEESDGLSNPHVKRAVIYSLVFVAVFAIIVTCMFMLFGFVPIPAEEIQVPLALFAFAVMSLLGWALFMLFTPIGLITLPMDLFNAFRTRPQPMSLQEYAKHKLELGRKASELLAAAKGQDEDRNNLDRTVTKKVAKADKKSFAQLQVATYRLKKRRALLEEAYVLRGGNPLWHAFKLFLGFVALLLTLSWIAHIVSHLMAGATPALNSVFQWLEGNGTFPLLGIIAFTLHAIYLLVAAVKGAFRFSLGLSCMKIYPMELGNTYMSAFLVNMWLVLALTIPLIQFCSMSFNVYAADTTIESIFKWHINMLGMFNKFLFRFDIYLYVMGGVALITTIFTIILPKNTTKQVDARLRALARGEIQLS
ncbi:unnamed protein product (mitochondrion) [Plasmodiophora brassicae]|uniref:LMBR1-like membrane protein n=1 Tax=Plasmodiophora brassicae TaxID=37360 RepID=A0A3P3Y9J6_PLABS|nr:unnamed protein product [Plasmodiophora brassicae]